MPGWRCTRRCLSGHGGDHGSASTMSLTTPRSSICFAARYLVKRRSLSSRFGRQAVVSLIGKRTVSDANEWGMLSCARTRQSSETCISSGGWFQTRKRRSGQRRRSWKR